MRFLATVLFFTLFTAIASSQSTKPNAATPNNTTKNNKPVTPKPKPAATPQKKPSERAEWDKAIAITDTAKRVAALKTFVTAFPKTTRKATAFEAISLAEAELGNEKLAAGDMQAATDFFKAATQDAPKPVPEKLFTKTLSKFPANLYFRGLRDEALEIARTLEAKAETNVSQLLEIATFYISIENGTEARRVVENAIKIDATSPVAYQTLGLANRVDFKLEESAAGYAKALAIEPDSLTARRGLAEMKRSLGKPDEAVTLYREILDKESANLPAMTGLIMALFDAEKRSEAEAEMTKSLEANPGNVILLAGAAYWYAAHNEAAQAVTMAQRAIESDPRFIWSHIALARALLNQNKPLDAERTLIAARRYGNFPSLEYEIASARLAAGLYREAAEELAKSFSVKDEVIFANLGGRVPLESKNFSELVGFERRASIFAPMAADNPDNAAKLKALLEFKQELASPEPKPETAAKASDNFILGNDKMKVHRQLYVASELLDKKIALQKVIEITAAAPSNLEAGLDVAEPSTHVMAGELYESRAIAAARGEYVNVPAVPRATLSAVLRGRIEELSGWAYYQMDNAVQAAVHLKRAVGVLPVNSAWWRSSTWRLGTALVLSGKDAEALDAYIKSYKSSGPDAVRYKAIEAVYKRVNGSALGLEEKIGSDPSPPAEAVAQKEEPATEVKTETPTDVVSKIGPAFSPIAAPEPSPDPVKIESTPVVEAKTEPTPDGVVKEIPKPESPFVSPEATPAVKIESTPVVETKPESSPDTVVKEIPKPESSEASPEPTPDPVKIEATPVVAATTDPTPETVEIKSPKPDVTPETKPEPMPESSPEIQKTPEEKPTENLVDEKPAATPKELFPSVIITIPTPETVKAPVKATEPTPSPTPEIKPCSLIVRDDTLTFQNGNNDLAVIVRREDGGDLDGLTAVSSSPENVTIKREKIEGLKTQAIFVVHSFGTKTGEYQILFEMPCGKKEVAVKVQ